MFQLLLGLALASLAFVPAPSTTSAPITSSQLAWSDPDPQPASSITGTHEITDGNGDPLEKDVTYTVEVAGTAPFYIGKLYRDDGSGPVYVEDKDIFIFGFFGEYLWENIEDPPEGQARGGGRISQSGPGSGKHDQTVDQGPHSGTERTWTKQ